MAWEDLTPSYIGNLYNKRARYYRFYERIFCEPKGIRTCVAEALELNTGQTVLELGCGQGKNLRYLCPAISPNGVYIGVDIAENMLRSAGRERKQHEYVSVELQHGDALEYLARAPKCDAILFSMSYHVMPHRREVLDAAWGRLKTGGRLVIFDAKPPPGWLGSIATRIFEPIVYRTVLGNPHVRGWEDLRAYDHFVRVQEFQLKSYYIAKARKY